jgi:hypothetical protein
MTQWTRRVSLCMIVPSKGRPGNASRLLHAVNETAGDELEKLVFAIDRGEEKAAEYRAAIPENSDDHAWDWVGVVEVEATPQRFGPVLNALAAVYATRCDYIGVLSDDHLPRTQFWDDKLIAALDGRPGVAYGNDLNQGEKLPTACVISSDIICSLGYMCPPALEHLYTDDFWKMLGQAVGNLAYCPDVVIEHLHPTVGKAEYDQYYQANNDVGQYSRDEAAYLQFLAQEWPACQARLRDAGITR